MCKWKQPLTKIDVGVNVEMSFSLFPCTRMALNPNGNWSFDDSTFKNFSFLKLLTEIV